jgi:ubiquinone/menaquinone biosynthesis C-methylase UbiE
VIALDISRLALKHARENVSRAGLFGFFQSGDIRRIPIEDSYIEFANDRGCFHLLSAEDRPKAVAEIHRVLMKKGLFLLRVFSDQETPGEIPHRFSKAELETLFAPKFRILDIWEGEFAGPKKAKSYSMLMEKK